MHVFQDVQYIHLIIRSFYLNIYKLVFKVLQKKSISILTPNQLFRHGSQTCMNLQKETVQARHHRYTQSFMYRLEVDPPQSTLHICEAMTTLCEVRSSPTWHHLHLADLSSVLELYQYHSHEFRQSQLFSKHYNQNWNIFES